MGLLDELRSILSRIRRVTAGDYVLADDHNNIVDALSKVRDILEDFDSRIREAEKFVWKRLILPTASIIERTLSITSYWAYAYVRVVSPTIRISRRRVKYETIRYSPTIEIERVVTLGSK